MTHEQRIHYWGELLEAYGGNHQRALKAWQAFTDDPPPTEGGHLDARDEDDLLRQVLDVLRRRGCLAFHADAGSKERTNRAKAGRPPIGWPDVLVYAPGGRHYLLELKTATGVLSEAQRSMHERLERLGHAVSVVRSVPEALAACELPL